MTEQCASSFLDFVNATGSPYHSVLVCRQKLEKCGFERLDATAACWPELRRGGRYYVPHSRHATLLAFVVGEQWDDTSGFVIAGSHTDSPCLRLRPNHQQSSEGYALLGLQLYGGGLWRTWFDRGLGFAGTAIVRGADGGLSANLVRVARPVAMIPSLAIHLTDAAERKAFTINTEDHLRPVLGSEQEQQTIDLLTPLVAKELGVAASSVVSMDLCLFDASPAYTWGANNEFIASARLDNLVSVWAGVEALCAVDVKPLKDIACMIAWDHEEVGSTSTSGADGALLRNWLERIHQRVPQNSCPFQAVLERSFVLSTDGAHGVHPNYPEKHQRQHKPKLNGGVVLKENANQRYCTADPERAMVKDLAPEGTLQPFVVRNDSPCGSTIGPLSTATLGVPGVDVGVPMWGMHSICESAGVRDLKALLDLTRTVLQEFRGVAEKFKGLGKL